MEKLEIAEYLTEHSDITNYVILDDDSDMFLGINEDDVEKQLKY